LKKTLLERVDQLARIPGIITGKACEFNPQGASLEDIEHNAHRLMVHHVIGDDDIGTEPFPLPARLMLRSK
jgi:hypothetical protein